MHSRSGKNFQIADSGKSEGAGHAFGIGFAIIIAGHGVRTDIRLNESASKPTDFRVVSEWKSTRFRLTGHGGISDGAQTKAGDSNVARW